MANRPAASAEPVEESAARLKPSFSDLESLWGPHRGQVIGRSDLELAMGGRRDGLGVSKVLGHCDEKPIR